MEIMRDLVMGDLRPLLDDVVVLVVPTINPDGAEVRRRTNDEGFDMNRDYLKLESQEIQALVTKVMDEWSPHIHVDTHHGGSVPYVLVFQTNMNPAGDQNLTRVRERADHSPDPGGPPGRGFRGLLVFRPHYGERSRGVGAHLGGAPEAARLLHPRQHRGVPLRDPAATPIGWWTMGPGWSRSPREEVYQNQVRGQYIGQRELIRFASAERPGAHGRRGPGPHGRHRPGQR